MQLQFEGVLKLIEEGRPFTDRETGEVTPAKFTLFFQTEDKDGKSKVVSLKSKINPQKLVDNECLVSVELYPQDGKSGFWASVVDIIPSQGTIEA